MKIKVRYENAYQTLEVDTEEMWVSLSLESDKDLTQEEKESFIQDAFEEKFNKPEYNNWHKFDRHRGNLTKQFRKDDETEDESDGMETVPDYSDEINRTSVMNMKLYASVSDRLLVKSRIRRICL